MYIALISFAMEDKNIQQGQILKEDFTTQDEIDELLSIGYIEVFDASVGVKYEIVETLPQTGEEGTIYLVLKTSSKQQNVYDEYMYINNNWELIGNTEADLSGKQDKIDSTHKLDADLVDDTTSTNKMVSASDKTTWSGKQDALVSGTNIKTINNESILGNGNITISGGGGAEAKVYSYNLEQYKSQYSTDAPSDLVQIMQSAITDFQNGNTVFIEDRVYNDTIKRLFILSGVQNNTAYFTCTGYEMEEVISQQYYNGYVYNKQFCYYIVYGVESHKIRMAQGMEKTISKYLSPVNQSTAFIPTYDSHPTSKKYVDKVHYENMTGYDAAKTQVLKNVNGTLTWVDE